MKYLINPALLKEQLKRLWPVAAFPMLIYLLFIIVPIYQSNINVNEKINYLVSVLAVENPVLIMSAILTPLIAVFSAFSYLFQAKTTATMHTWPFNKTQLWFTNVLAGLILIVVPIFVMCLFLLVPVRWSMPEAVILDGVPTYSGIHVFIPIELFPNGLADGAIVNTLPMLIAFFGRAILVFGYYYSIFLTAAFIAGNAPVYFALSGAMPLIPTGLCVIYQGAAFYYCFGYQANDSIIASVFTRTNAAALPIQFNHFAMTFDNMPQFSTNIFPYILGYIVIGLSLFSVSFWLNKIRSQERASDSVVFNPVKNVLVFLVSVGGLMLMGAFFLAMSGSPALMYLGFAFGFVLAYFSAQMIAEKTINVLHKTRSIVKHGAVVLAFFAVIALLTTFDLTGYEKYVPETSEIEGVYLGYSYKYEKANINPDFEQDFFINDTQTVTAVAGIHKEIVNNRNTLRKTFLRNLTGNSRNDTEFYEIIKSQEITYKLTNGKIVTRHYVLPFNFMEDTGFNDLIVTDTVVLSKYHTFRYPELISRLQLYYYDDETQRNVEILLTETDKIRTVIPEIQKDISAAAVKSLELEREQAATPNTSADSIKERENPDIIYVSGHTQLATDRSVNNYYRTYDHFGFGGMGHTVKWLISNGYLDSQSL